MLARLGLPLSLLLLAALAALLLALGVGSAKISPAQIWDLLQGEGDALARTMVMELRLPRALSAFAVGGLLAVAGALMQVLLRNPLADPYVLGLSGGASIGALAAMLGGLGGLAISSSAFSGALFSTFLVFGLAHGSGGWTPSRLLLTGVVVAAGWGAVITLMLALSPAERLPGMLYWLMGDLSYARTPWPPLLLLLATCVVLIPLGRSLNVLARGPQQAAALGVAVRPLEWCIYVTASLLTACALAGGTLLVLADTLARTMIAPEQLPVGVITALLGVPTFLFLLYRSR